MKPVFEDEGFEFDRLMMLGSASRGLTDVGEVLVALDAVTDGDHESWITAFTAVADRLRDQANTSAAAGHTQSARSANLRASSYYATASGHAAGVGDPEQVRTLWEQHRSCWDDAVAEFDPPVEKISIPYEDIELEGYFFHASPSVGGTGPRPTVILNNGSDGPVTDMWAYGAAAAVERGWHAVTFDGPGQNAALYRQGLFFRPDWEAVITPIVDFVTARDDVDSNRIAMSGVSQAGYWVPRSAAFEHRLAACVADPGTMRVADSWTSKLPKVMADLLDAGNRKDFDAFMEAGLQDNPEFRAILKWRMAPYGVDSYFDAYTAAREMHLDAETLAKIECPMLITSPDHEQFWPGQSEEMHGLVKNSTLMTFTEAEGADWHCEPAARLLRDERICNWLADVFDAVSPA